MKRRGEERSAYQSWLWGEVVLIGTLACALGVFLTSPGLPHTYQLPEVRLVVDVIVTVIAAMVATLTGLRYSVEGRRLDLLLCCGFAVGAASTFAFAVVPVLGGEPLRRQEAWTRLAGGVLGAALVAAAPLVRGRSSRRRRALLLLGMLTALMAVLGLVWTGADGLGTVLPPLSDQARGNDQPLLLTVALSIHAQLSLIALVGFGLRFRSRGEDLDRWLALGSTVLVFAELGSVFTPLLSSNYVTYSDFLRLLSYAVLLVGVWRAMRYAEFGRAVAEERARVAREIHDGLAQYLFALSTQASMLDPERPAHEAIQRLKEAVAGAQQEARFAVLALSSASGNAPFDAALRRYVDFLTADGTLEVELEIDPRVRLGPDEQIEVFRIVQEGLANVRKHARTNHAEVRIASEGGRRHVVVRDDGRGLDGDSDGAGQGLRNMQARAASIGGAFQLRSEPGRGTALEVVLRI